MPISGTPTPSFSRPPLVEVALGVEFSPVSGFGAVALVKLADRLHGRYPIVQEYSPLPPNPPIGLDDQIGGGLVVSMGAVNSIVVIVAGARSTFAGSAGPVDTELAGRDQ